MVVDFSARFYVAREDQALEQNLSDAENDALDQNLYHAFGLILYALRFQDTGSFNECLNRLSIGHRYSVGVGDVWTRLVYAISAPLLRDLWGQSLQQNLPVERPAGSDSDKWNLLRNGFCTVLASRRLAELELWPSQIDGARRVFANNNSFAVALPTSAGKTRLAELCILKALSAGDRALYITPLRALSAQVERGLRSLFGPLGFSVSALYGAQGVSAVDSNAFEDSDVVVATPEKAGFALRNAPQLFDRIKLVVFDEAHMVANESRGIAYEALVIALKRREDHQQRRFLALSALLPELEPSTAAFATWISNGRDDEPLRSPQFEGEAWRPTRQCFGRVLPQSGGAFKGYRYEIKVGEETSWVPDFVMEQSRPAKRANAKDRVFPDSQHQLTLATAARLLAEQKSVLIYCPRADSVEVTCREFLKALDWGFLQPFPIAADGQVKIERAIRIAEEALPYGSDLLKALRAGLAIHHGQLPRTFLREIDRLIAERVVRVVVASPTVNAGLNICATCVLFNGFGREREVRLNPWGQPFTQQRVLDGAESMNVSGRAGRAFVDTHGEVLGICFNEAQVRVWTRLREKMRDRSFTSGLAVVLTRFLRLLSGSGLNMVQIRELILNQSDALWDNPTINPDERARWDEAEMQVDQALLALVDNLELDLPELGAGLDAAIRFSFFTLATKEADQRGLFDKLLHSRAKRLWRFSTPAQRKGWFCAGVGLRDGLLLDERAEVVAPLLRTAEDALEAGGGELVIELLTAVARLLFEIPIFLPSAGLPDGWPTIFAQWLRGEPQQLIHAGNGDHEPTNDEYKVAARFIEEGVVYRLTWAIESIRVRRPDLFIVEPDGTSRGLRCTVLLEAGTLSVPVAVLLQLGLGSRKIAHEIVRNERLEYTTQSRMRAWVRFQRERAQANWDYLDAAVRPLWLSFIYELSDGSRNDWSEHFAEIPLGRRMVSTGNIGSSEGFLRLRDIEAELNSVFVLKDGTPVGLARWPFASATPNFAKASIAADGIIRATYFGP